jgi:hypothetical protein
LDRNIIKSDFLNKLKEFANSLGGFVSQDNKWTIRGFIDIFKNIYTISSDTKIISKIIELHIFPRFLYFAEINGYEIELATYQNWYPDLTFISKADRTIKFAVDLKTTYRDEEDKDFCNGFTLGSHGTYFIDRTSTKNIQYPYNEYLGHFCLGIIYSRSIIDKIEETKIYNLDELLSVPAVISDFVFFAEEKWKIASDKSGSGNTANIGSIVKIDDILAGNGMFIKLGEKVFDEYWANYGVLKIQLENGEFKKLSSLREFIAYKNICESLYNPKKTRKKM